MFAQNEIAYLEEYVTLMTPIAEAIDFLQGEKICFGFFIPTLLTIKAKQRALGEETLNVLKGVNEKMLDALLARFEQYFLGTNSAMDALIAAVVTPELKLKFIKLFLETAVDLNEEDIRTALNTYASKFADVVDSTPDLQPSSSSSFLIFDDPPEGEREI